MQCSLLTIGDELLIGQVLNSNVTWMSSQLTDINCTVTHHLTVGDQKNEINEALDYLKKKSDVIIIGGGLGPTHDDLTMEALSEYFEIPLIYDEDWIQKVDAYFKTRNRVMSENNKKQGYLLKSANRIDNSCGTAAGQHFFIKTGDREIELFVVPGVPFEMKSMMEDYILPKLSQKTILVGEKILRSTLLTTGIGESLLAEKCAPFVQKIKSLPEISLAFLPSSTQVRLRLQTVTRTIDDEVEFQKLVEELKTYCGKDFFGFEPETIDTVINTHLHWDHVGGNTVDEGGLVVPSMPNARYLAQRGELEHGREQHQRDAISYRPVNYDPLLESGRMHLLAGDAEVLPGLQLTVVPGHNRTMMIVTLRSGGQTWCHLADLVQFGASVTPTWVSGFDLFPLEAIDNKDRILTRAASEGWWCSFGHDPAINFAQVETKDGKWRTINNM